MNTRKTILLLFAIVLLIPLISLFLLSERHSGGDLLFWYRVALEDAGFISALRLSFTVAFFTSLCSTALSFLIAMSWFDKQQKSIVILLILLLGLIPGDIEAISINKLANICGIHYSNIFIWTLGLVFYTLPYNILVFWSRFYFIDKSLLSAAADIGLSRWQTIFKIMLPLSVMAVCSAGSLSFILSFNDYSRSYYLSGPMEAVSEYLNGALNSGTNESIYAGGALTVLITVLIISGIGAAYMIVKKREKNQLQKIKTG